MRWNPARWSLYLLVALAGLLLLGALFESHAAAVDRRAFPPPGRLIDIGGYRLHLLCKGPAGPGPTIVMVAGGGPPAVVSYPLQDRISRFARVCSYDRAGLGWSDPAPHALSFDDQVRDLETLLTRGHVPGPYLFVPESFGSLVVIGFAQRHPHQVAGVVFLDGVEPGLWFRAMPGEAGIVARAKDFLLDAAWRVGLIRLAFPLLAPDWVWKLPPRIKGEMIALYSRWSPGFAEALRAYAVSPVSRRPRLIPGALGSRPVIVISHGVATGALPPAFERGWAASQARLARWSRSGSAVTAKGAGHEVAEEAPAFAAQWVRRAYAEALKGAGSG